MITSSKRNKNYRDVDDRIVDSFLTLVAKKRITEITITEICNHAGINHTTFYRHYKGIWQIPETLHEFFYKQADLIIQNFNGKEFFNNPSTFFNNIINKKILENIELYKKLSVLRTAPEFFVTFAKYLVEKLVLIEQSNRPGKIADEKLYASIYFSIAGICFVYISWLRGELKCSLETVKNEVSHAIMSKYHYNKEILGYDRFFEDI